MADAHGGIDLAAPLLSVRRRGGGSGGEECTGMPCRKPDDDATPGSGVPFRREHRPGHPKSVRTRRTRAPLPAARDEAALVVASMPVPEAAATRFSDALSRADSCFTVDCSVTGLSDASAPTGAPGARGGSVMMDRFLWAAKAVAVGSSHHQRTFQKAGAAAVTGVSVQDPARPAPANARTCSDGDRLQPRQPHVELERPPANHVPSNTAKDDTSDGDGEWDAHSTAGFASRRCGLLPSRCVNVKTTLQLLLLNPAQAMRRGRGATRRFLPGRGEGGHDDTLPLLRRPRKQEHLEHDVRMQTWEEVYINSLLLRSDRRCMKPQATMASELDRTVRALCSNQGEGAGPKATHLGLLLVLDRSDGEHHGYHCSSAKTLPEAAETASLLPPKCSGPAKVETGGERKLRPDAGHGFLPPLEKITASHDSVPLAQPVLTLPKPKSPSESWLSRALPSVSIKPPATSFLGIHVQQTRKQAASPWCSSDQVRVIDHARPRQMRIHDLQK